jgi:hypothetical protein
MSFELGAKKSYYFALTYQKCSRGQCATCTKYTRLVDSHVCITCGGHVVACPICITIMCIFNNCSIIFLSHLSVSMFKYYEMFTV